MCRKDRVTFVKSLFGPDGVSSSDDDIIFKHRLEKADECWRELVTNPKHLGYFKNTMCPKLKTNFETKKNIPWVAELGNFTNNNCESINSVFKHMVEWKTQSLTTLVSLLKKVLMISAGP